MNTAASSGSAGEWDLLQREVYLLTGRGLSDWVEGATMTRILDANQRQLGLQDTLEILDNVALIDA
jgi:hypothetical protein